MSSVPYRGRLAPSPTGYLHIGHARTFWTAQQRAAAAQGVLVLRSDDIDAVRARMAFAEAMLEDLRWLGLHWQEGPDCGGPFGPYEQSQRRSFYQAAFEQLHAGGWLYPCRCTRQDVLRAVQAPQADLLLSTARQLLLYRALGCPAPAFYHCPLVTDEAGVRLAKRHDALSLRTLRQQGLTPERVRARMKTEGAVDRLRTVSSAPPRALRPLSSRCP